MNEWLGYLGNALNAAGEGLDWYQNNVVRQIVYGALYQAAKSPTWSPILGSEGTRQALIAAFERGGHEAAAEAYRQGEGALKSFLVETLGDPTTFLPVVGCGGKALAATRVAREVGALGGLARGLEAAGWVGNLPNEALGGVMGAAMRPVAGRVNALLPDTASGGMMPRANAPVGPGVAVIGPAPESFRFPPNFYQLPREEQERVFQEWRAWKKRQMDMESGVPPTTGMGQAANVQAGPPMPTTAGFQFPPSYWDLPGRERRRLFQEWWEREGQRASLPQMLPKSDVGRAEGAILASRAGVAPTAAKPRTSAQVQPLQVGKVEGDATPSAVSVRTGVAPQMAGQQAEAQTKTRIEKAVRLWGTTTDPNEAGFILPDGRMLKVAGGLRGERQMIHGEAAAKLFSPAERKGQSLDDLMFRFLDEGSIRVRLDPGTPAEGGFPAIPPEVAVQFTRPLTEQQLVAIRRIVAQHGPLNLVVDAHNLATGKRASRIVDMARQSDVEPTLRVLYERVGLKPSGEGSQPRQLHALVQSSVGGQVAPPAVPVPLRRLARAASQSLVEETDLEEGQDTQGQTLPPLSEEGHRRVAEAMLAAITGENGRPRNADLVWRYWRAASDAERAEMWKDANIRRLVQDRVKPAVIRRQTRPLPIFGLAGPLPKTA